MRKRLEMTSPAEDVSEIAPWLSFEGWAVAVNAAWRGMKIDEGVVISGVGGLMAIRCRAIRDMVLRRARSERQSARRAMQTRLQLTCPVACPK